MSAPQGSAEALASAVEAARLALALEARSIERTSERLGDALPAAIALMARTRGRILVSGLGKSGLIGAKIAATLASTGTPAQFVHAAEALHGDSGAATPDDAAVLISNSGETFEVCYFARMLQHLGVPIITMAGREDSTLAHAAEVFLDISVEREADPLGLAPTASTATTLAVGDALAAGLMTLSGFTAEDFAVRHPGGSLGAHLSEVGP
jgi:arabinose-5-phosphate isomerase